MIHEFVGRQAELDRLSSALGEAIGGSTRVAFVAGAAGAGKSKLVEAFVARAEKEHPDLAVAVGACDSQTGIGDPYLPFFEIVQQLTGIVEGKLAQGKVSAESSSRLKRIAKVSTDLLVEYAPDLLGTLIPGSSAIVGVARSVAEKAGLLEKLQSRFDTAAKGTTSVDQQRIMESYAALIRQLSTRVPLVLVIDDLHWVDTASCGLLFHLAHHLRDARVLVVGTYRANDVALGRGGDRHPLTPVLNELQRYHGEIVIDLDAPDEAARRAFISAIVDAQPNALDDAFREKLYAHTRGHALFTVELLRALQDRGCIVAGNDGRWRTAESLDWSILPSRVEGVIEERIGRLEDELRDTLRIASVEGENFTVEILARVKEISERALLKTLSDELEKRHQLVNEGNVEKIGARYFSHYNFAHALFQQYLYNQIGRRERMMLHGSIAGILEDLYAGQLDAVAVQLAHHYSIAGDPEKTFEYSMSAARRVLRIGACTEVMTHTDRALACIPDLDPERRIDAEIEVQLLRGHACQASQGWDGPGCTEAYDRVAELAAKLPQDARAIDHLVVAKVYGVMTRKVMNLDLEEAEAIATEALRNAEAHGLTEACIHAHEGLTAIYYWMGDLPRMLQHSRKLLQLVEKIDISRSFEKQGRDPRALPLYMRVIALFVMGNVEAAQEDLVKLQAVVATGHPYSVAIANGLMYAQPFTMGDAALTITESKRALAAVTPKDSAFYSVAPLLYLAWAEGMLGDREAIERAHDAFRKINTNGGRILHSIYKRIVAEIYASHGMLSEALAEIDAGIALSDAQKEYFCIPELHRTRGNLLRAAGRHDDARAAYETAIDHARRLDMALYESSAEAALAAMDGAV